MKRSFGTRTLWMFSVAMLYMSLATTARAEDPACSLATLKGKYAFTFNGFENGNKNHHNTPLAGAGVATFDGAGNMSALFAVSFNGVIETNALYTATYTVDSDCTALMRSTNGGDDFHLVIIGPKASEIWGASISTTSTWTIAFKKQ
jgi:hypothetical protein